MDAARQTPNGERHSLVPNGAAAPGSRHGSLNVPLLNEESLKANNSSSSATSGGFTLVSQGDDGFKSPTTNTNGVVAEAMSHSLNGLSNNLDHNRFYTMLQQQQAVAMAAAQLEQAYNQTCYLLQQCSHNALLTVLMSLLNDYPTTLVQPIRVRVEQVLAQQMSPSANSRPSNSLRKPGSNFVPNSSAAPWAPSNVHGSAAPTPTANSSSGGHRRGRGHKGKEEEQEMCSLHNNMRAMKHLQLNQATGLYECIHGFHCLVDGPADLSPKRAAVAAATTTNTTPSLSNSASRGSNTQPSADSQPFAPAAPQQQQQQQLQGKAETRFSATEVEALRILGYSLAGNGVTGQLSQLQHGDGSAVAHRDPETAAGVSHSVNGGGGYTVVGDDHSGSTGTSPLDARLNMDIPSLEYLLQSVRDIDDE
jgi:hypothetical protein